MSLLAAMGRFWRTVFNPPPRGSAAYQIGFSERALWLRRCDQPEDLVWEVEWSRVVEVVAFKRDLFAVDLICVAFDSAEYTHEVNEDMQGWDEMLAALPGLLPSIAPAEEWWTAVALPAFATNATTIFDREGRLGR